MNELSPKTSDASAKPEDAKAYLREKLLLIQSACEEYDQNTADKVLSELMEKTWPPTVNNLLDTIAKHLLHSDFDVVVELVKNFNKSENRDL